MTGQPFLSHSMRKEPPARPQSAPPGQRKTPPGGAGERPPHPSACSIARARPYYTASQPLFPKESRGSPATGRDARERLPESLPGKAGSCRQGSEQGEELRSAARRLTPHPRPVPCARSTPPPSPRSAWRAISPHSGHSSARVSTAAGELQVSLSPGLAARPSPEHDSPPERESIPACPGRAGG